MSDEGDIIKSELFGAEDCAHGALAVSGFKTRGDVTYQSGFFGAGKQVRQYLTAQFFQGKNHEINVNVMLADGRFQTVQALKEIDFKNGDKAYISRAGRVSLEPREVQASLGAVFEAKGADLPEKPVGRQIEDVDAGLVARMVQKDTAAFETLYHKHYDMVRYVVKKTMSERLPKNYQFFAGREAHADVEDVTQEVFATMWNKAEQFTPELSTFKVWLSGVARHQAMNVAGKALRYNKRFEEGEALVAREADEGLDWIDVLSCDVQDYSYYGTDPLVQVMCEEWQQHARGLLDEAHARLRNEDQKRVIVAMEDEIDQYQPQPNGRQEKSTKIIAAGGYERLGEALGISPSATKSALFRAKNLMRDHIEAHGGDGHSFDDFDPLS